MAVSDDITDVSVEVYERYKGYECPVPLVSAIRGMLESVPRDCLIGLQAVVLTNQAALTRRERQQMPRNVPSDLEVGGLYHSATRSGPAWIELFVDNIFGTAPKLLLRSAFIRDLLLAKPIFHELGHHIDFMTRKQQRERERAADDLARELRRRYVRKRYWYLLPILWPVAMLRRAMKPLHKSPPPP